MFLWVRACFPTCLDGWRMDAVHLELASPKPSLLTARSRKMIGLDSHQNSCIFWRKVCDDEEDEQTSIHTLPLAFMSRVCWRRSGERGAPGRQSSGDARREAASCHSCAQRTTVRILNSTSSCCPVAPRSAALLSTQEHWQQEGWGSPSSQAQPSAVDLRAGGPCPAGALLSAWAWRWCFVGPNLAAQCNKPWALHTCSSCDSFISRDHGQQCSVLTVPRLALAALTPVMSPQSWARNCVGSSYPL